jgi:heme oxygenase
LGQASSLLRSRPELCAYLRESTAGAHLALEVRLDLMAAPTQAKVTALLERFLGFHAVWEPALSRWPRVFSFMEPRSRLADLRADLTRLGGPGRGAGAVPPCTRAPGLLSSEAAAVGSAYVLEGSTMGGQLITRALSGAAWAPRDGLAYFNPYGAATGPMWRAFKAWADGLVGEADHAAAADGAVRTFALLEDWLAS